MRCSERGQSGKADISDADHVVERKSVVGTDTCLRL
jgi:hypothetical protein